MARKRNDNRNQSREPNPPALIAWHVNERDGKKFWSRIGAAWDHEDAKGLTVILDLVPVSGGHIVLREPANEAPNAEAGA